MEISPKELINGVIKEKLMIKQDELKKLSAIYKITVTGESGGVWRILCNENIGVEEGDGIADCSIVVSDNDFIKLVQGKLNPKMAFMTGKLKQTGDIALAMKLGSILG